MTKFDLFMKLLDLAQNYYDEVHEAELNHHNGNTRVVAVDTLENKKLTIEFRIENLEDTV